LYDLDQVNQGSHSHTLKTASIFEEHAEITAELIEIKHNSYFQAPVS
jgi:hypothetical protein